MGLADLTIGRYYPVESVIHNLDARVKLLAVLTLTVSTFLVTSIYSLFFIAIFALFVFLSSRLPVKWVYKAVKPVFYLLIIAFLVQAFFTPGRPLFEISFLKVTYEGLALGAFVSLRVLIIVCLGSIMTFTTEPIAIADGLEYLMTPLKVVKLPVHEIALTVTLAIRFIPELLAEAQKIALAQQARGADFKSGNIFRRARSLVPLFVPLLVSAFLKAEDLGKAMEARSYRGSEGRTKLFEAKFSLDDYVAILATLAVFIIAILIR